MKGSCSAEPASGGWEDVGRWEDLGVFWRLIDRSFYHKGMGSRVTVNTNLSGKGVRLSWPALWAQEGQCGMDN